MKKLTNFVRKTFNVSPSEARGVIFILGGMCLLISVPFLSDYFFSQKTQTIQILSPKSLDSLTITLDEKSASTSNYQHYDRDYSKNEHSKFPTKLFLFNPNTASVEDLESLGIPNFLAFRIDRYRSKGGKFRKKEDLAKIYDFSEELYARLEPYISLPSAEQESTNTPQAEITSNPLPLTTEKNQTFASNKPYESKSSFAAKNPQKFDMNTADTTTFKNISGIGSGFAKRIIKYRDMLGGFVNAEQVRETYGLAPETADELLKFGYIKTEVKKLKINDLPIEQLRHPYLKYFQAKAIISYREQHGKFKSIEDLKAIKVLEEATIEKIKPYLVF